MKLRKTLTAIGLLAMLGLNGCTVSMVGGVIEDLRDPPIKTVKEQDSLVGFVINQNGQLVMLGQRYVYVFNNDKSSQQLKQILTTPEFLKLKYHWEIEGGNGFSEEQRHKIAYYRDQTFNFSALFWYQFSTKQELKTFQKVGFATSVDEHNFCEYCNQQLFTRINNFQGKIYQHNASTQALLKTAKPLSKPYQFGIDRQKPNRAKSVGQALLLPLVLPFTLAGDILILPISLPVTIDILDGGLSVN